MASDLPGSGAIALPAGVTWPVRGYDPSMSESTHENDESGADSGSAREPGEIGIRDEDLPEDLQPTDDNPLAQNPDDQQDDEDVDPSAKVDTMPDLGDPAGA